MGIAMASILYPMYNQTIWRVPEDKPALEWPQFGLLVGIVLLFDFGALSNFDAVLYFIAILSTLGVLALLTMVFSIVWVMIMKQDNAFDHLRQLWLPAVGRLDFGFYPHHRHRPVPLQSHAHVDWLPWTDRIKDAWIYC